MFGTQEGRGGIATEYMAEDDFAMAEPPGEGAWFAPYADKQYDQFVCARRFDTDDVRRSAASRVCTLDTRHCAAAPSPPAPADVPFPIRVRACVRLCGDTGADPIRGGVATSRFVHVRF